MGRVAKYKKVKKFDLHNEKNDSFDKPPKKKDKVKLPNSFRTMKYQKEKMERIERIRKQQVVVQNKKNEKDEDVKKDKPKIQVSFRVLNVTNRNL